MSAFFRRSGSAVELPEISLGNYGVVLLRRTQPLTPFFHEASESMREFQNARRFAAFDSLRGDQLRAHTNRGGPGQDESCGCLLGHASRRNEENLRQCSLH